MTPWPRLENPLKTARAQRAGFIPSNRELDALMRPIYGRGLDTLLSNERSVARLVFAQAALMAGAALAADSATFFGAERLWRDMQDKIGVQERALARRFLELLSQDPYYSRSEQRLISTLGSSISDGAEWKVPRRDHRDLSGCRTAVGRDAGPDRREGARACAPDPRAAVEGFRLHEQRTAPDRFAGRDTVGLRFSRRR